LDARQTELVKSLFKMVWADGQVSDEEIDVMCHLLDRVGLPWAEKMAVMDQRLSAPQLEDGRLDDVLPDQESRLEALELLITVGFSDNHLPTAEMHIIEELALRWEVNATQLEQLRQKAMQTLAGGR
jgi:uncharacterized tellurite resistance protein B-like protein